MEQQNRLWSPGQQLPYLDQPALHSRIDFNQGTAVGTNTTVISRPLPVWRCPADIGPSLLEISVPTAGVFSVSHGNYAANDAMMTGLSAVRFRDVTDGLSSTALVSERAWRDDLSSRSFTSSWIGILATASTNVFDSIPFVEMTVTRPPNYLLGGSDCFSSYHSSGVHIALGDGSTHFFSENLDQRVYAALGTIGAGDTVSY